MYDVILFKIEQRKKEIQEKLKTKYWGIDFSYSADFADDLYLNNLYKKLENSAVREEYIRMHKLKKGPTLRMLAQRYGIGMGTLENRIYNLRWSLDKALTTPVDEKKGVIHF